MRENRNLDLGSMALSVIISEKIFPNTQPELDYQHPLTTKEEPMIKYRGFDMTGFGDSFFRNMSLLSEFSNYIETQAGTSCFHSVIPVFWKGTGRLVGLDIDGISKDICDITGWSTDDIIFDCLVTQNPNLLKYLETEEKQKEEAESEFESDLSVLTGNEGYTKTEVINKFKRDLSLVKELKEKHNCCQLCGFTFKKKDGKNYNEVHHIIPLSENGKDAKINTLILCANCHRQMHHASVDITKVLQGSIIINGEEKLIKGG